MGEDAAETPHRTDPSKGTLAALSLAAFTGLLLVGGAIGLLVGPGDAPDRIDTTMRTAAPVAAPADIDESTSTVDVSTTTLPATTATDPQVANDQLVGAPRVTTTVDETASPATVEVRGVVELGLDLVAAPTASSVAPPRDIEFVELPKGVYDRFSLAPGELLAVNIAANDKIGGQFEGVRATGLGELPPGFVLQDNGVLSGSSETCGAWRQQYELLSDNPAIGTSWIEITIAGC